MRKYSWAISLLTIALVLVGAWWYIGRVNSTHPAIWPMYGGDSGHRFQAKTALPAAEPKVLWTFPLAVSGLPVVGEDSTVYLPQNRDLLAVDANGKRKWLWKGKDRITFLALGRQGTIYAQEDKALRAFDANGQMLWSFPFEQGGTGWILVGQGGTIYVETQGRLYALTDDGKQKWTFDFAGYPGAAPAETPNGQIVLSAGDGLYLLNRNGETVWKRDDVPVALSVVMPDGSIYIHNAKTRTRQVYSLKGDLIAEETGTPFSDNVAVGPSFIQEGPVRTDVKLAAVWGKPEQPNEFNLPIVDRMGNVVMIYNGRLSNQTPTNRLFGMNAKGEKTWDLKGVLIYSIPVPLAEGRVAVVGRYDDKNDLFLMAIGDR